MPVKLLFNSWIQRVSEVMYLPGATRPDPTKFYCILSNSNTITRTMDISSVVALELSATNGYSRQALAFSSGSYDTTDQRYEFPNININFTASGGSLQFQTMAILCDANPTVGNATGGLVGFRTEDSPITILNGRSHSFVIPFATLNPGYVTGV